MRQAILVLLLFCGTSFLNASPADSLLALAAKAPDAALREALKCDAGIRYYKSGVQDSAFLLLTEGSKSNSAITRIRALSALADLYADRADNPTALRYYQKALTQCESSGNAAQHARIFKSIGALYLSWNRFEEALDYYQKAEVQARVLRDSALVADCCNNRGTVYEQQGKLSEALQVYQEALAYYQHAGRQDGIAMTLSNMAIVYKKMGDFNASIDANKRSLAASQSAGDIWMVAATLNNIGNAYGEHGDYKEAVEYCNQSLAAARKIDAKEIVSAVYESLAGAATKAGDYKAAVDYYKHYTAARDSFINAESLRQLSELQVKYETTKKQKENEALAFKAQSAERRRLLTLYISLGVSLALAAILVLGYRARRAKDKLAEERQVAQAMFDSEQRERIRIARDLHDSIGQMLAVTKMRLSTPPVADTIAQQQFNNATAEIVDQTVAEVRAISHNLIPEDLTFGTIRALENLCRRMAETGIAVNLSIADEVRKHSFNQQFSLSLYRIVQEVLGNMMKHSGATETSLYMMQVGGNIILDLSDNGKGFDTSVIGASKGIGWKNVFARVRMLNGSVDVSSERISGTRIQISLPQ